MDRLDPIEPTEKDAPLRYDIRLLGRILGDTVRAQEGEEVFELVEHIRRTGVQFHRNADEAARQELQKIMSGLPTDRALSIIRAFGYFSHLANIAEDQHHIRRTRAYAKAEAPPRPGTMAYALGRARQARLTREQLQGFFDHALCSPVLTAHPTEIRRKSSIDREMEIARLLDERDRIEFTPEELAANRRALRRNVLTLWQTSLVRGTRLRVIDEVANGLSYYDYTFLRALPLFYADLERLLGATDPAWQERQGAVLPAHGKLDRRRPRRQSLRHRRRDAPDARHAKRARHALLSRGAASARRRAVARRPHRGRVGRPARRWPTRSPDRAVERQDEPYRRAIVGMYARLAATAWALDKLEAPHPPVGPAPAYDSVNDFKADLDTIFDSLSENGSAPWRAAACALCAARSTSSASIWHRSTCGRIRTCTSASWPSSSRPRASATIVRSTSRPRRAADTRARQHAAALLAASQLRRGDGERARHAGRRGRCPSPLRPAVDAATT